MDREQSREDQQLQVLCTNQMENWGNLGILIKGKPAVPPLYFPSADLLSWIIQEPFLCYAW